MALTASSVVGLRATICGAHPKDSKVSVVTGPMEAATVDLFCNIFLPPAIEKKFLTVEEEVKATQSTL